MRKSECKEQPLKVMSLASVVLNNICIDMDDKAIRNWDIGFDQRTNRKRPLPEIRDLLHITKCRKTPGACINAANI